MLERSKAYLFFGAFSSRGITVKEFDVVFFHPPRVFDDVPHQAPFVPMGSFSLASMLSQNGFHVKMFNLSLYPTSSLQRKIESLDSKIFAIDLHWAVHSEGAMRLAELCKRYHPSSLLVIGGFAATWFNTQILDKYPSVDVVVLGEGEEPLLNVTRAFLSNKKNFDGIDGISYRERNSIRHNPIRSPLDSLDQLDFVDLSLMDEWKKYIKTDSAGYRESLASSFWLPIARGCTNDCVFCGGGRTSYELFSKRKRCIFRSTTRIADEVRRLYDQGVLTIRFSHDPEIGSRKYCLEVLSEIKKTGKDVSLYWESFGLPSKVVLEEVSKVAFSATIAISPESPSEEVRMRAGRNFTNDQLLRTIDICEELGVGLDVYFNPGLPGETPEFSHLFKKMVDRIAGRLWTRIVPPVTITLDPNCLMAIYPEKYDLKLWLNDFEDYRRMCSSRDLLDWIGYETPLLSRERMLALLKEADQYVSRVPQPLMRPQLNMTPSAWQKGYKRFQKAVAKS